ncbi:hypothetical protein [Cylindrospermopsis raciborskii]|uniref:hypothetical protein n=1 Tax=Cylindrospermopsis raciborskii TaxID=77022 RepID=UPI00117828DA|nr:hypothetical protein [Cylindrospermopsis raciborskii]
MQGSLLGNHSLRTIAPPHVFILQNCDRPLTPFKFSLEQMQGSLLGNHLLQAIAPPHIFIVQNCDRQNLFTINQQKAMIGLLTTFTNFP